MRNPGLRFGTGTGAHYGWADVTVFTTVAPAPTSGSITLHAFGIESVPGTGVTAGDPVGVPEPSSWPCSPWAPPASPPCAGEKRRLEA